ncbi:MAG: DUF2079 domain-containing protein [Rhizobiales bacterium]|nr:DUF2079 domain-containing protein [Hyphomicrobiales bacterium]
MALLCVLAKVVQVYGFALSDYDTGIYANVAWNLAHGEGFHSDVLQRNHLAVHFSPLTALFAPFYALFPTPMVLMIGQGLAAGITLLLLYRIAGRLLDAALVGRHRDRIALGFCLLAFVYGPFANALLSHFHPPTVAMPILAGCLLALIERRTWPLVLLIPLLLSAKENAPLAVVGLGAYAALVQGRWRLGLALGLIGMASLALILLVIMPAFQDETWVMARRFQPLALLGEKALYLVLLLLPLAFLPLLAWRAAAAALPLIAVNLASGHEGQLELKYHYNDLISIFLVVAAMHGFNLLPALRLPAIARPAAVLATAILLALVVNKGRSPVTDTVRYWPKAEDWALHRALAPYREAPADQAILAQSGLGPYVSNRHRYVMLTDTWKAEDLAPGDLILLSDLAGDYLVDVETSRARLEAMEQVETVSTSDALSVYRVRHEPGAKGAAPIKHP